MSGGLRDLLQLPEPKSRAASNGQADQFSREFAERIARLNVQIQASAPVASPADFKAIDGQRARLYEAYQKVSARLDSAEGDKAGTEAGRVMTAVSTVEGKASALVAGAKAGHDAWVQREATFDDAMMKIGELEEAKHPKAGALRKLGEAIRGRANARAYQEASTALDQLGPKLDGIYAQHQQEAGEADEPGEPAAPAGEFDRQASCLITVRNETAFELTLSDQQHVRGDFMTFPAGRLAPGATCEFVSVETPESTDKGCQGFVKWHVEGTQTGWHIEWDNPEEQRNTASYKLYDDRPGFRALAQIGQGDENVPTAFTLSFVGDPGETPPGETPPAATGQLPVRVTDSETREPVAGATVSVGDQSVTTDNSGAGALTAPVGPQNYQASAENYEDQAGDVEVAEGANPELAIVLTAVPGPGPCPGGEETRQGLTILVREKDSGAAIEGASVTVGDQTDTSSAHGLATVELPVGAHSYQATHNEYEPATGDVDVVEGDNPELVIEMGGCGEETRQGLSVLVKNAQTGEGIEGAAISVGDQSDTTSGNGLATVELPVGAHDYEASADGFEREVGQVEVVEGDNPELVVELTPLPVDTQTLSVLVKDKESGEPIASADVTVGGEAKVTSNNGLATVNLPVGTHDYEAKAADYTTETGAVEVVEGANDELVIELTKGPTTCAAKLTVSVVDDASSEPVSGATVTVADKTAQTGGDGVAVLELDPGTHNYEASAQEHESASGTVEVQEGDGNELTIRLKKSATKATVTFQVTDQETGEPVDTAMVTAGGHTGPTDASGVVSFDVEAGAVDYTVQKEGYETASGTAEAAPDANTDVPVALEKAADWEPPPESKQPTLRKGDQGADGWVEYLQKLLNKYLGANTAPEDGVFEQSTYDAVKQFQGSTDPPCLVDGIVGNETWSMLRKGQREAVGVNEQPDEQGAEARWATEKNDFVTYDAASDVITMVAFSVGDAPVDSYEATFKITSEDGQTQNVFDQPLGAPTGPSPTGAGHMHGVKLSAIAATYGNGKIKVEAYMPEELGGDLWSGTVDVQGNVTPPSQKTGSVSYLVVDRNTQQPIETAKVTVAGQTIEGHSMGTFVNVAEGDQPYSVTARGYKPDSGTVKVVADQDSDLQVALEPEGPPPPPPSGKTGSVSYLVVDKTTQQPIETASVTVAGQTIDGHSMGTFVNVEEGVQPYRATAQGYKEDTGTVQVVADEDADLQVALAPEGPPPVIKTGSMGFTVTDVDTGDPIAAATVSFASKSRATDASGVAVFDNVEMGTHAYTITHPEYENGSGDAEVLPLASSSEEAKLKRKESPPGPVGETGRIGFTVTDIDSGDPVSAATVSMAGKSQTTDASGIAILEEVAAGSHPYTISHPEYETLSGDAEVLANASTPKEAKLKRKPTAQETGTIGVTVEWGGGGYPPVTMGGFRVYHHPSAKTGITDDAGKALLSDVPATGESSKVYAVNEDESASGEAAVTVVAGETVTVTVKVRGTSPPPPPPTETGKVIVDVLDSATGKPVEGATVSLMGPQAYAEKGGRVTFEGVAAGDYSHTTVADGYTPGSGSFKLEPGATMQVQVKLDPLPTEPQKPETPTPPPGPELPEHKLVTKKMFTHKVHLKDTNYINEELGHWLLRMEVGLTGTGQAYPLHVDVLEKLKNPANNIVKILPTIKAKSENVGGKRSCDITFTVQVAGPNVTSSSGGKLGGSVKFEPAKVSGLELGVAAEWTITEQYSSQAIGAWSRRFTITGGSSLTFAQDASWKSDLDGDIVVDDEHGHDGWGVDTDWELHTYDG